MTADTKPADPIRVGLTAEEARQQVDRAIYDAVMAIAVARIKDETAFRDESDARRAIADAALKSFNIPDWQTAAALMSGAKIVPTDIERRTELAVQEVRRWGEITRNTQVENRTIAKALLRIAIPELFAAPSSEKEDGRG